MKKIIIIVFISIFFVLLSCSSKSSQSEKTTFTDNIPSGAIPFEYDEKMLKAILFNGVLNDSIHLKILFDTGWMGLSLSDSLRNISGKHAELQIGNINHNFADRMGYIDMRNMLFQIGKFQAIVGWEVFTGKIIKISFRRKYMEVLDDLENMTGYDSVKMIRQNHLGLYLAIPTQTNVQGKFITEYLLLDTGSNGNISYNHNIVSKYNIKSDSAYFGKSRMVDGLHSGFSIPVDTIKVGKYFVSEGHYAAFRSEEARQVPFSGLLGTRVLENFDIVFDFKNFYLYLKPVEK